MKLYHWSTNIVTEPRIKGNCGYGFYLAKNKNYSRIFGDMLHKVTVSPKKTCIYNDSEVKGHAFFNIDKEHYDEYISQGYDSLAWYRNGKLTEFVVLKPEIIKDIEFIGSRINENLKLTYSDLFEMVTKSLRQVLSEKKKQITAIFIS